MSVQKIYCCLLLLSASIGAFAQGPVITKITPVGTYPNNSIVISGSGFSATAAQLQVTIDNVAASITASSDFSITATVPPQARLANVQVINLSTGLSVKSAMKFVPSYSGVDLDPSKLTAALSFSGGTDEIFDVCSCDLDGDGKPDLAGSKQTSPASNILLLRNTSTVGSIGFASTTLTTSAPMINLACGDLNGDGKPDLIATRSDATKNEVFIYRNTSTVGSITFATVAKVFLDPGQAGFRIVVRDVNLDGKPEIIVSNSNSTANNTLYVFVNQSSGGTLTMNATPIKVSVTGASTTYGLDVQDLDGDNKPEIITNQFNNNDIFIVPNTSTSSAVSFGTAQKITLSGTLIDLTTADFNQDGKLDIAVTGTFEAKANILLNTTSGSTFSFAAPIAVDTGADTFGIDASDIDGDGDIDIITGNLGNVPSTDTQFTVLKSDGNNSNLGFTRINVNVAKKTRKVNVRDFDGDGKPDVAFTTAPSGKSLDIWRNANCFLPKIQNAAPLTVCAGQTIRLTTVPGVGVSVYDWKESGVSQSSGTNAFYDITTAGNYTVTATSESGACITTSTTLAVTAGSGSVPTGNPPTTTSSNSPVCIGNAVQLNTPAVASVTYQWTGPNGFTSSLQNPNLPSATAANAGTYTLILTNGTCQSTPVTTQVEIASLANFAVTSNVPSGVICQGSPATLTVNSASGHTYQWINGAGDIGGQTGTSLVVTTADSYSVRVTNTLLSCSTVTSPPVVIKVVNAPVAAFTVKSPACVNEVLTFTNTSTTDPQATPAYAWTFGDTGTSTVQSPTHAYASANTFSAGLTVSYTGVTGCSNNVSKSVSVTAATVPTVGANPTSSCPGDDVVLSVSGGTFTTVTWTGSLTGTSVTVKQPGTYTANTTDQNGCTSSGQVVVTSKPVPVITVTTDKTIIGIGESAQLAASGADIYRWTPPETLSSATIANPVATPTVNTTYTVLGSLTGGCSAQKTIDIQVNSDVVSVKPPNVFSPNGDGINDLWVIQGAENYPDCTLTIFSKEGARVFEQKGYKNNWDGLYEGKHVPAGTYYYVFGCPDKTPVSGHVLVAR
jgi:gliding motility-associated-like protein